MINKIQCPEGHFYNANKFDECPVCNPDTISSLQREDVTVVLKDAEIPIVEKTPVTQGAPKRQENVNTSTGKTKNTFSLFGSRNKQVKDNPSGEEKSAASQSEPTQQGAKQSGPVKPEPEPEQVETEKPKQLEPVRSETEQQAPERQAPEHPVPERLPPESQKPAAVTTQSLKEAVNNVVNYTDTEDVRTMAVWSAPAGSEPVVGWLVCVKGEYVGQGFNLKAGNNSVGRSMEMDIALAQEMKVSRNRHCIITFEPDNQEFYLQQGDSSGLTYLNKKMVMTPQKMEARDTMKIGDAEFIFVPFCVDGFNWETYLT